MKSTPSAFLPHIVLGACLALCNSAIAESDATGHGSNVHEGPADVHRPHAMVVRTEMPPRIDGTLDDEIWEKAEAITSFRQVLPVENGEPTERTEMRLLFDSRTLYIGIRCFDRYPDQIVAAQMQRDANVTTDDHITIVIDPFDRARSGYEFQVSAAGGMRDGLVETDSDTNYDWRGYWQVRVRRDELGWTATIAIPFNTISFNPDADQWRMNVERWIRRNHEQIRWASPLRNTPLTRFSAAGAVTGLDDLHQGLGLTVKPFARLDYDFHRDSFKFEPGVDIFYNITPSVTLALTVNTDFAETEVDDVVVNLTRFPTFFPEKRDFFLQDARLFEFGGIARSPLPFFSRRIGIVRGEEKDILAGAKLTGRHGDLRFGLMNVQMKDDAQLGHKNLTVARAALDVLDESSIGFIVTHGDPATRGDNTLAGIDFNYLHRDPLSGDRITGNFYLMGTYTDAHDRDVSNSDPIAYGASIGMPNEPWSWRLGTQQIGHDFNPAMGFVQRRNRRLHEGELNYRWRPDESGHIVRSLDIGTNADVWTFMNNEIEQVRVNIPDITVNTRTNEQYYIKTFYDYDKLVEPFEIIDDVLIPVDTYDTFGVYGGFRTSTSKPAAFRFEGGYRSFYTGHRIDFLARLRLRPSPHFYGGFDYERNEINLGFDSFTVHILRAQANIIFSPQLSWANIVQWDNQSKTISFNSRIRWEFKPGQELFVVYNDLLDTERESFRSLARESTVKLGMTFHF